MVARKLMFPSLIMEKVSAARYSSVVANIGLESKVGPDPSSDTSSLVAWGKLLDLSGALASSHIK